MSPSRSLLAIVVSLSAALTLSAGLASPATAANSRNSALTWKAGSSLLHFGGHLNRRQTAMLSAGTRHPVIVLLRAVRAAGPSRLGAVRKAQAPILHELRAVHARRIHAFKIINAIAARVSSAEALRLRGSGAVRAVVADAVIKEPVSPRSLLQTEMPASKIRKTAGGSSCSSTSPQLAPEALGLTKTAFQSSATPQAQNLVDGTGITVAFLADGVDPFNPDFVRPDGTPVFVDAQDFTGEGYLSPSEGSEAFGDASSIAAQGNYSYPVNSYLAVHNQGAACRNIRIVGMAPGASLMALKVYGQQQSGTTANFVEAIQYAVFHGANVINESFGSNPYPDYADDPIALADEAAIHHGVSVVNSSGDSGTAGTIGSPGSAPGVITVGATTQLRSYKQANYFGFQLSNGHFVDNNISSFSSAGISQSGLKTPDVVAPGDLGWADCSDNWLLYTGCLNLLGLPTSFQLFGGTSESSPLTAGEAALVDEAFARTHGGNLPSPALVRQIIMSTATDLSEPSYEQGAGLIDSLRAVEAAGAYRSGATPRGHSILTQAVGQSAMGQVGSPHSFKVTLTNTGSTAETVVPKVRRLVQNSSSTLTVHLNQNTDPTFTDEVDVQRSYAVQSFHVGPGQARLDASIAWNVATIPFSLVRLTLLAPGGAYAAFSFPQDPGLPLVSSGYGHVDVRFPAAGTWKAIVWTKTQSLETGYTGPVSLTVATSRWHAAGTVSPATVRLKPGASASLTAHTRFPASAGDLNEDIGFGGKAGAVPIVLRALVPTSTSGGSFTGSITGGNGRPGAPGQTLSFVFSVPAGMPLLSVGITVPTPNNNLEAVLVDPYGLPVDTQSTVAALDLNEGDPTYGLPASYRNAIQLSWRAPEPGVWRLLLIVNNNIGGTSTTGPIHGTISFAAGRATGSAIPSGKSLAPGHKLVAKIAVTNTGPSTEEYFIDPRLAATSTLTFTSPQIPIPPWQTPFLFVPTHTSELVAVASAADAQVLDLDCYDGSGAPPFGGLGSPDILGAAVADPLTGKPVTVSGIATSGSLQVPSGIWVCPTSEPGPFPLAGARKTTVSYVGYVKTRGFDPSVQSSTGDVFKNLMGLSNADVSPLTLRPGKSGTITVIFTGLARQSGKVISGSLDLDAIATSGNFVITGSADTVKSFAYSFRVSG